MSRLNTHKQTLPKEQRLVRNDQEIKALQHSLAARFGYWALTKHRNNENINDHAAITFFGRDDN